MVMSSMFNNFDPTSGFDPRTALSDLRNQMMDAYGQMQQRGGASIQPVPNQQPMGMPPSQPTAQPMPNPMQIGAPMTNYGGVQNQWSQQYGVQNNPFMQAMNTPTSMPQTTMQGGGLGGGGGMFGLPVGQGAPGGDAISWLSGMGMPIPSFLSDIAAGRPTGAGNYNDTLMQLGNTGGLPSLQTLGNLNPSELEFLAGYFETVLGIPFNDVLAAVQRPFERFMTARMGRTNWQ